MNSVSFGPGSQCGSDPIGAATAAIISLLQRIACRDTTNLQMTSECLTVTEEGAWGSVGDVIQALRWFDGGQVPPTSFVVVYVNTNTNAIVTGVTNDNTEPCSSGGDGCCTFTNVTANVERRTETAAGNTPGGDLSVSFTNVGSANGVVAGQAIYPGQTVNITAFTNEFTKIVSFVPLISYDGTGTTLSIIIMN